MIDTILLIKLANRITCCERLKKAHHEYSDLFNKKIQTDKKEIINHVLSSSRI